MTDELLTPDERRTLDAFVHERREGEMAYARKLFEETRSRLRIAQAYGDCVSEWEQTKALMLASLDNMTLPPDTSAALYRAMIEESERITEDKLQFIQIMFEMKFGASIFKYRRPDAKSFRWFGLLE